jgi:molecular chaperone HtpG
MASGHDSIYFLPGDSEDAILKSPLLQKFKQKDVEVLLLFDPIDEFCMQHLSEYEKYRVKSIAKEDGGLYENDITMKKKQ